MVNTSKLFIPYLSQFRATCQKARRSVKKRIEPKVPEKSTQEIDSHNIVEISTEGEVQTVTPADSLSDETISINIENNEKPEINQYWEISDGKDSSYAYFVETDPFMVQFFEPNTSRSDAYLLNDVKFEVLPEDFFSKGERSTVGCSRKKPCRLCILLSSFFHEQF